MYFKCIASLLTISLLYYTQIQATQTSRFENYLLKNTWDDANYPLPFSYRVPKGYFPINGSEITEGRYDPVCRRNVTVKELQAYTDQTEMMLTTFGLNLYDGAVREIALALLGHFDVAQQYEKSILVAGRTMLLDNIRASAPCKGVIYSGDCKDESSTGECGFCYGQKKITEDNKHAYFFRLVTNVYAFGGVIDARCPEKRLTWAWNDWRPVTGENAWANFLGPLHVAYLQAGKDVNKISDDSSAIQLALAMTDAFEVMQMELPNVDGDMGGPIAYAPYNTYDANNPNLGATVSTENCASALASLRAFLYILENKQASQYKNVVPRLQAMTNKLTQFLKRSYNPKLGYFVQGGSLENNKWSWNNDPQSSFAVDCQTWVMSVLGATTVDSWFGKGTALKIWENTKIIGGYKYDASTGFAKGVGFSINKQEQVFSGEWSFGAINMLKIFAKQYTESEVVEKLLKESEVIRSAIESELTVHDQGINSDEVFYANKRYWIPFGWRANPIPSTASVAWAVMVDSDYNPFTLGGSYL